VWSGPAAGVVADLVTDEGVGDADGAVRQRAADDAAVLAASLLPGGVPLRGRVAMPQADTEVDQRPAQRDAAFRLIRPSRRLPADSYCIGDSPAAR